MNEPLDIIGQNPRLSKLYTQLCLCFALNDAEEIDQSSSSVVEHISRGLANLTASVPWISGQVITCRDGVARIMPLSDLPPLRVRNLADELPCFNEFRQASFPFSMLDEKTIASCKTLPVKSDTDLPAPVISLQLNFLHKGLLLVVDAQHNCMDMRGQSQIVYLLSKACRGERLSEEEIASANIRRANIIPLLADDTINNASDAAAQEQPSASILDASPAEWSYWSFSPTTLKKLKTTATQTITTDFISTDDVLSAFVWQSVTRARKHRLGQEETQSTFERQVDARKHMGISEVYTGNVTCKISVSMPIQDLLDHPLGSIASRLREAISPQADIGLQTRKAATQLRASLQKSSNATPAPAPAPAARPKVSSTSIKMSSWAKEDCYDFDFGGALGKPEAVRRPRFDAWEGLAYMMPRSLDGEIVVALCLRAEDLQVLKRDGLFGKYTRYIG